MTKKNQKFVSVDASVLGFRKAVPVLESNRNHILASKMQVAMAELDETEFDDYKDMLNLYTETIEKEVDFLTKTLKLDEKQVDALYDLDQDDTIALIMEVISKIMHITLSEDEEDAEVEEEKEAEE